METKIINVGAFQVDLEKLQPLTLGDQEVLAKEPYNVDFRSPSKSPTEDINLVWFVLRKVEPQITREAVSTLSVRVSAAVVNYFTRISSEVELPLGLVPSTPSRGTTAGAPKT